MRIMRIMKLMGICLLTCFLQNCEDKIIRTYRLENGTEREIKMEFYEYGIFRHTLHIIGEGLIFEGSADNDAGKGIAARGAVNADSVIVIFDNAKIMTYTNISRETRVNREPSNRNFLLNDAYEIMSNELYRFVFTEEDYKNAADIEG